MIRPVEDTGAYRLLVSPYHPDTLRQPASSSINERLRHALTWNVFKTLEQIAPTAWMRPLVARSSGLPENYRSAPHITAVTCWSNLAPAPSAMLRRGRKHGVPIDAIIDTDDTVITVLTPSADEMLGRVLSEAAEDSLLDVVEATAYLAGTRAAYGCVVLPVDVDEQVWGSRIRRRADRVRRVLASDARGPANVLGIGVITWHSLHELLIEVGGSPSIAEWERRCAETTARWMGRELEAHTERKRLA